tara:strand:- start:34 stop:360 length:327 start_codon:yes stop_codon:yes gene_type:complete
MNITKSQLEQIIKEEVIENILREAPGSPPSPEEILQKAKINPEVLNDYYSIATGDGASLGGGLPEYLTQEFAQNLLYTLGAKILLPSKSSPAAEWADLVDIITDKLSK